MVGARTGVDIEILSVGTHDQAVVSMIESAVAARVIVRSREQRPNPNVGSVGHAFHDASVTVGAAVGRVIRQHIDRTVPPDGHAQHVAHDAVIRRTVNLGAGRSIRSLNRARWSFDTLVSWDMNTDNELQKLTDMAESPEEGTWTFTSVNGSVWQGKGAPVGDHTGNGNASTFTLKVSGGLKMKKIL